MFHSFFNLQARYRYLSLFSPSFNNSDSYFWFCWLSLVLVIRPTLGNTFVSKGSRVFCASHSLRGILDCAYTSPSCSQIETSCTSLSGSLTPPSHVLSNSLFGLICCNCLLYYWSFRVYHHITNTGYFLRKVYFCLKEGCVYGVVFCCY